jgi:hypothetical protein
VTNFGENSRYKILHLDSRLPRLALISTYLAIKIKGMNESPVKGEMVRESPKTKSIGAPRGTCI